MTAFITRVIDAVCRRIRKDPSCPAPQAETIKTPPVPAVPFTTQAQRRRELMMAKPSFLYIYDTANDVYHDRECKFTQAIPDEAFRMLEGFPKEKQFCSSCYRKAMIRKGIASQSHRINSYVHAFNGFGAKNEDLYKLFITHKAQVVSISKGEQAVCLQVKDDRWRIQSRTERSCCTTTTTVSGRAESASFMTDSTARRWKEAARLRTSSGSCATTKC